MSDRFACGIVEKMIPRYVRGGCTDAEKRFLEKHCAECIECSVMLIHEKNKMEVMEEGQFDRTYEAESRDYTGAGQEDTAPEYKAVHRENSDRAEFTGLNAGAIIMVTCVIICIALGTIVLAFVSASRDMALHFKLEDYLSGLTEGGAEDDDFDDPSDYSGPVELPEGEDHVMDWKDPVLEERMREITGIVDRDIMYSDVLSITWLNLSSDYSAEDEERITDISALAEFENLTDLLLGSNAVEDISPLQELTGMIYLDLSFNRIRDLEAIGNMKDLTTLVLSGNQISDPGFLAGLESLVALYLDYNRISDISPLEKLTGLEELSLAGNSITDITPLQDLEKLTYLNLTDNKIREIDILENLTELEYLYIWGNPIEDDSVLEELDIDEIY